MKKIFFLTALFATLFTSCTNTIDDEQPVTPPVVRNNMKASEVFAYSGGNQVGVSRAWSKKEELGYSIPNDGKYDVWFYIRIDGKIPGEDETHAPAGNYFPATSANKTLICDQNHGTVLANVAWNSNAAKNFPKYIYCTDGKAVQSIIVDEPTIDDLLNCNQSNKANLEGYIAHKNELHFIWYACKQQASDHIWHVDGILTSKEKTDLSETDFGPKQIQDYENGGMINDNDKSVIVPENVEVDIHQQQHTDWNEIKTSIHLRDNVGVEVFLPIDYAEQADDFAIRRGIDYDYITELKNCKVDIDGQTFEFNVNIKHEEGGIRITVDPNKDALEAARKAYGDGITFEIHNYVAPAIGKDAIWGKLQQSTVTTTGQTLLLGQITSAYYPDDIVPVK